MAKTDYVIDETPQSRAELRAGQYGGHPNAEALIRAHFASISPEVRSGIRLPENADALAAAKDADAGASIEVPDGGKLVDWSVRGSDPRHMVLSYVWEDVDGRWHHGVQAYDADAYEGPKETTADRTMREVALHDAHVQEEAVTANAAVEAKLAEMRAEMNEEIAKHFADLTEGLAETVAGIVKDAQKGEGSKQTSGKANRGGDKGTSKKSDSTGESGAGDASAAPKPDPEGDGGSGDDGDEPTYPRTHADLDKLAKSSGETLPEDWDDLKTDAKVEWLEEKGVKPE